MEWIWGGVAAKRIVYIYIDPGSSLFLADWQFFRGEGGAVGLLAVSPIGLIWTRRPQREAERRSAVVRPEVNAAEASAGGQTAGRLGTRVDLGPSRLVAEGWT